MISGLSPSLNQNFLTQRSLNDNIYVCGNLCLTNILFVSICLTNTSCKDNDKNICQKIEKKGNTSFANVQCHNLGIKSEMPDMNQINFDPIV